MKKLNFSHVIKTAKIIKDGDIKEQIVKLAQDIDKKSPEEAGITAVMLVVDLLGNDKTSKQLGELLTDIFEQDVNYMSLEAVKLNLSQLAKENNILSFFKSAGTLTQ